MVSLATPQNTALSAYFFIANNSNQCAHIKEYICPLKEIIEGKTEGGIEVAGRQERKSRRLLRDIKETRGYWRLKEEALARNVWRTGFGRRHGPVVRQTKE
jgi:hypothetical protein